MEYLKITNWEKWQTYRSDRGQPPWIKIHRCVMRNPEWVSLSDAERGQLVAIWLLAADHDGVIPASAALIQKLCYMSKEPNLSKFNELGFINGNMASSGRQDDVNVTLQTRIDKTREDKNYVQNFDIFYSAYPLKKGKQAALKSWIKNKPDIEVCLDAIKTQTAEKIKLKLAKEFCPEWPNPVTWLNQGCWEDEIIKTEKENERDAFLRRHGATK